MTRGRLLALALAGGCAAATLAAVPSGAATSEALQETGPVTYITDGDTVDVKVDGASEPVRLLGVQAMEAYHPSAPDTTFDACHAAAARERLRALVSGKTVQLWSQSPTSENRGRLLRSVMLPSGSVTTDVQRVLLEESLVLPFPSADEPAHNVEYMTLAQQVSKSGAGIWDTDSCGSGPSQTTPFKLIVNADAEGDDTKNVNGEWVSVQNLSSTKTLDLSGWWVRDSSLALYTLPKGTVVKPLQRVTVKVGKGTNTTTSKFWGLAAPVFDNTGDGAYLFDPDGDLRAWMMYPCLTACADPELGNLIIRSVSYNPAGADADHVNSEWVKITNTSTHSIRMRPYSLLSAPYSFVFGPDTVIPAGKTLLVRVGKGTATSTTLYWGKTAPILGNGGDRVELTTYDGIRLDCRAWGTYSC
jgi:endonuclease YncB( thermonuclease family)